MGAPDKRHGGNWNVKCALGTSLLIGLADSVWNGTVLATYIYDLRHSNTFVGIVEAANGLTQLFIAYPVGAWADSKDPKTGKKRTIFVTRLGCPATLFASIATGALIWGITFGGMTGEPEKLLVWALVLANVVWGAVEAVVMGPFQAMFGDSLPTGDRSYYYALLYAGYIGASAAGPSLSIALFAWWGNDWSPRRLARVLVAGMALECVSAPCYLLFRDSSLLGAEADAVGERGDDDDDAPAAISPKGDDAAAAAAAAGVSAPATRDDPEGGAAAYRRLDEETKATTTTEDDDDVEDPDDAAAKARGTRQVTVFGRRVETATYVPWTLFTASILSALGSGATVKFFPLFFKNQVGLSPIETQLVYVVVPLAMVAAMSCAQSAHPRLGRVQTMVAAKLTAVGLLVAMIFVTKSKYKRSGWVMVPIYVVRTALANCTYPIEESILMDYVPRDRRARWKSLESIASFGWCGSALLGGIIADAFSYSTTFGLTAALQTASAVLNMGLIVVVPKKEADLKLQAGSAGGAADDDDDTTMDFDGGPADEAASVPGSTASDAGDTRISLPGWRAADPAADENSTTNPLLTTTT